MPMPDFPSHPGSRGGGADAECSSGGYASTTGHLPPAPTGRQAMRRSSWPSLITALVLASGVGCITKPTVPQKVPSDPLLSSKKPIEGHPSSPEATRAAVSPYPLPPPAPAPSVPAGVGTIFDDDQTIRRVSVLLLDDRRDGLPQAWANRSFAIADFSEICVTLESTAGRSGEVHVRQLCVLITGAGILGSAIADPSARAGKPRSSSRIGTLG